MRDTQPYIPKPHARPHAPALLPAGVLAPTRVATIAAHAGIGQRLRWQGTVSAFTPELSALAPPAALYLTDIVDMNGVRVWAEVWLRYTGHLRQFGLCMGEMVAFVARVDRQLDGTYTLNRPSHFERIAPAPVMAEGAVSRNSRPL